MFGTGALLAHERRRCCSPHQPDGTDQLFYNLPPTPPQMPALCSFNSLGLVACRCFLGAETSNRKEHGLQRLYRVTQYEGRHQKACPHHGVGLGLLVSTSVPFVVTVESYRRTISPLASKPLRGTFHVKATRSLPQCNETGGRPMWVRFVSLCSASTPISVRDHQNWLPPVSHGLSFSRYWLGFPRPRR